MQIEVDLIREADSPAEERHVVGHVIGVLPNAIAVELPEGYGLRSVLIHRRNGRGRERWRMSTADLVSIERAMAFTEAAREVDAHAERLDQSQVRIELENDYYGRSAASVPGRERTDAECRVLREAAAALRKRAEEG